jgi:hypothetical protein
MKRFVTIGKALGLAGPVALALFGLGCVNLDEPAEVAECAANKTCSNGEKKDAAVSKDDDASDSGNTPADLAADSMVPGDTRVPDDALPIDDGALGDHADGRADSGADAGVEGGQPDTHVADVTPDAGPADAAADGASVKDGPGSDTADAAVPDTNRPPLDTGPNNVVTFNLGKGVGAMTGYGWAAPGSADIISSPTCAAGTPITSATPCLSQTNWGTAHPTALCVTGSIPSTTTSPNTSANWGIQVGVNARDPDSSGIGQSFKTVAVNASSVPTGDIRIEVHRSGDAASTTYCAHWTNSTTPVLLTSFNTNCWDLTGTTGTKLTEADLPKIDEVGLQVSPSKTDDITLTNLCMQSITFGN